MRFYLSGPCIVCFAFLAAGLAVRGISPACAAEQKAISPHELLVDLFVATRLNEGCDGAVPEEYEYEAIGLMFMAKPTPSEDEIEAAQGAEEKEKSRLGVKRWCATRYAAAMDVAHAVALIKQTEQGGGLTPKPSMRWLPLRDCSALKPEDRTLDCSLKPK